MIISIAISFTSGALWNGDEDFESADEGYLYAMARGVNKYGKIDKIVVVPQRATGLVMCEEISSRLKQVRFCQSFRGEAFPC